MKERPILFSGPMVRAILEGRKTQTRRVAKEQPKTTAPGLYADRYNKSEQWAYWLPDNRMDAPRTFSCPYGVPGDQLWVRETIERGPTDVAERMSWDSAVYAADGARTPLDTWTWKRSVLPSIHCPRGLSRITLEVTGVRVERLQDISEEDAEAEGAERCQCTQSIAVCDNSHTGHGAFREIWKRINGADSWAANPWVWVVEFKRLEAKERAA